MTNSAKSIPKLVVRDAQGRDLFVWGPRPEKCQAQFLKEKQDGLPIEEVKANVQKWYNQDKGKEIQKEIITGLKNVLK